MSYILIHGLGQNAAAWDEVVAGMKQGEQILCPDLPSLLQGNSPNYEGLYTAFCRYCETVPEPLHLCGLSLGAILALHYTIEHGEKVVSLVLIGGQYKMPKALLKVQGLLFSFLPKSTFAKMGFPKKDFLKLASSMAALDFSGQLKGISCNTLVLCGEKDKANRKAAKELGDTIPNAKRYLVANAGHEVNIDAPQKLAEALHNFYWGK